MKTISITTAIYCELCGALLADACNAIPTNGNSDFAIAFDVKPCRCAVTNQEYEKARLLHRVKMMLDGLTKAL